MSDKYSCGLIVPSCCVPWVGGQIVSDTTVVDCYTSTEEIIQRIDKAINTLQKSLDISQIKQTADYKFIAGKDTWASMASIFLADLTALKYSLSVIQTQFNSFNIGNITISVDLKCFAGTTCNGANITIAQCFEIIFQKMCEMLTRLNEIDPSNATSGDQIYLP
jgi:hypothetical protein